ncbi:MAG TPA: serpin family protein, partial [Dehalococcoidia bacterium]|nr:serpin family protein [Dehalococcoidia bacterium]
MRKIIAVLVALTLIPASAGCSAVMPGASADVLRSPEPRETDVSLPSGDLENLVQGNGRFAFDLYRYLGTGDGNLFYSPHSISMALAMAYAGACAGTAEDMARALHFDLPPERLHATFNYLDMELASRGEGAEGKDDGGFRLNIVNAIWGQKGYPFLAEYLDVLARCYGAGLRVLDFVSAPDESRAVINDWVEEQTGDRIKELIPRGAVDELTRLVLTNAVYFNAAWASQFEEADTSDGTFFLLDGNEVTVPMMRQVSHFRYADYGMYEAVELPYDGHE